MTSRLARSAGLIGAATMTSRVLGVVRETVFAALFGAGNAMDAFNVAFRIPNLLRDLLGEGAMSAAFVPAFTRRLLRAGRGEAWRLGNVVINAVAMLTIVVVVVGWLIAPALVRAIAPQYASVPGKLPLTITLTRILLPFLLAVAVSAAFMGMLNSLRRFFVPALSPAMFNVATIASAFILVPLAARAGWPPITGIAIGALLGGVGQVLLQWPVLRGEGWRYRPVFDWRDDGLREILMLVGPGTLGLAAVQVNVFVNTMLATGEGTGAVSWLNYAFRLVHLPIGLFGASIATAALPEFARHAASADLPAVRKTVSSAMRLMLMMNVPAAVGLIVLARPVVALVLEHGQFSAADTAATAGALMWYAPGLIGYSAVKIASPGFYALGNARTPVAASVIAIVANLVLNVTLVRVMGYRGLAAGTSAAALLNAAMLLWQLRGTLQGLEGRRMLRAFAGIAIASIAMGAAAWSMNAWLEAVLPGAATLLRGVRVLAAITAGLLVLAAAARLLRIDEFQYAMRQALARLTPSAG
ncbi:MAG TPA: murein biosynthesis integral membrane protein MurJ [Vicinamibacterales bacterium]|nr:murein biosynthesis integral membrane protein MurJ [Vicinamibacterales bacterium]